MQYKPHSYQHHATEFITTHPQAAIFLGMGLGKTVITLTALEYLTYQTLETRKTLIIAPLRVARDTWTTEANKWDHLAHLRLQPILGTPTQREQALATEADIYVINRENIPWLIEHAPFDFDTVIIDELSSFKNHQAKRFKALKKVRPRIHRMVGLTGTPAPNSLLDLWAPFRLLDEGKRLGRSITRYRQQFFQPRFINGRTIYDGKIKPGAETTIYDAIADMTLSMKTTDYLRLPKLSFSDVVVSLTPKQRGVYEQLKDDMVTTLDGEVVDASSAGVLAGKLQQLASGAIYHAGEDGVQQAIVVHDQKLAALSELVETSQGNTLLVAYWFKHDVERIQKAFTHARVLNSDEDMADWRAGRIELGLIHPASAGHGLNLQAGGHMLVWFSLPWSLELYEQTNARLFRQGQTEPVQVIHLVAKHTIDEQVLAALAHKRVGQDALVEAVKAQLGQE